jgi:Domain of Unknown Function with PDB structure (DUF3862)
MRYVIPALAFAVLTSPASACDVMREQYDQLKMKMTYAEVVKILGCDGDEMSSSEVAGFKTSMYVWQGTGNSNMDAMFQNGRLISKAQMGLVAGVQVER